MIRPSTQRAALLAILTVSIWIPVAAEPVGDALVRTSVLTRSTSTSVLLGAAEAGERIVAVGERGIVLLSDDSGKNWRQVTTPVSITLTAVRFVDSLNGIAVGHAGTVLTTNDAGQTWVRRLDGREIAKIALASALKSGDTASRKSANRLLDDGPDKPLLDVLAVDEKHALVVGAYGLALGTEDGGKTWSTWRTRIDNPQELHLYAIRQRRNVIVIAGEQGLLLRSDDAGRTFKRLAPPYKGSFFTVELPNDRVIIAAGLRGNVWRTEDDGATWTQLPTPMSASITASAVRSDGTTVFVNQAGTALDLRENKITSLNNVVYQSLNGIIALADGRFLGLSIGGPVEIKVTGKPTESSK